jgi:hypothetical protein
MDTIDNSNEIISEEPVVELKTDNSTENEPINEITDSEKTGEIPDILLKIVLHYMF